MRKTTRWLKGLFGIKTEKQPSEMGAGICHNPATIPPNITPAEAAWLRLYFPDEDETEHNNKHAIAVAAATAAAADAAVAAAHAAAEVVRLTSRRRNHKNSLYSSEVGIDNRAAIRIQTHFRSYLARRALRALKGLVKIQALVRGYLVRKQATATLHGMQALIRAQATVRSKRASIADPAHQHDLNWARPFMVDAQSKRLSASFEARTLNPSIDPDTPKVVEVDIGQPGPGSRSTRKGPGSRTSFSELGDKPSSYQILPPLFQLDNFQAHHQLGPARISIPNHNHQCCPHYQDSEWGPTTSHTTPRMGCIGPMTPARTGPDIFHHAGWGRQDVCYYNYPNYMAKTTSFKAKVRSHSAPKQRPDPSYCTSSNSKVKKKMCVSEMMEGRNSVSGGRLRSCSQVQEAINFKNAVMGRLGRSPS